MRDRTTGGLVLAGLLTCCSIGITQPAQKDSPLEREVRAALKEGTSLRDRLQALDPTSTPYQITLVKALAEVRLAQVLLKHHPTTLDAASRRELEQLSDQLQKLDKDRQLLERLEQIRLSRLSPDGGKASRHYQEAFREYGIGIGEIDLDTAANRLRGCPQPVRTAILTALDDWGQLDGKAETKEQEWLSKLVRAVDADPWRDRLRDALLRKDRKELEKLATAADAVAQPSAMLLLLAEGLLQSGAKASALTLLRRAQQQYPQDFWICFRMAKVLAQDNEQSWEEAIRFYTAALAVRPQSPAVYFHLGHALRRKGAREEARDAYRQAIRLRPDCSAAHVAFGDVLAESCANDEAVAAYRRAIELEPNHPATWDRLGVVLMNQRKLAEAITAFRQAIKLKPDFAGAHHHLGKALHLTGKLDEAVSAFRQAIRLQPDLIGTFSSLGHALADQGKLEEAMDAYHSALKTDPPSEVDPLFGLGRVFHLKGMHEEAIRAFRRAAQLMPDRADYHAALAAALKDAGRPAASAEAYRKAFTLQPGLADNLRQGDRYQAARAAVLAGSGQGKDAGDLNAAQRADWRKQALAWLGADLASWTGKLDSGPPVDRKAAQAALQRWQQDAELAFIRDEKELARLPAEEQRACKNFWVKVQALVRTAREE
jgi:tetratricopeptide (TPR) repeat protein